MPEAPTAIDWQPPRFGEEEKPARSRTTRYPSIVWRGDARSPGRIHVDRDAKRHRPFRPETSLGAKCSLPCDPPCFREGKAAIIRASPRVLHRSSFACVLSRSFRRGGATLPNLTSPRSDISKFFLSVLQKLTSGKRRTLMVMCQCVGY